jgi:hypothetical protein
VTSGSGNTAVIVDAQVVAKLHFWSLA